MWSVDILFQNSLFVYLLVDRIKQDIFVAWLTIKVERNT